MAEQEPSLPQLIGGCIYCGSRDGKLQDEHVIPYGLGGSWILEKASCAAHAKLTSAWETDLLRHAWGAARAALGVRTRRKKQRAEGFELGLEAKGVVRKVRLSHAEHPAPMAWPVYAPPGVKPTNPKIPGTPVVRLRTLLRVGKAKALATPHGADSVRFRFPDPLLFARFLGKVGYGFAVACSGLEATRNAPLLHAILSDSTDIYQFVGNVEVPEPFTGDSEQEVAMGSDELGRVVYIRLLGVMRAPEYVVRVDTPGAA